MALVISAIGNCRLHARSRCPGRSCFGLICAVTCDLGLVHVQALHRLAGNLSDEVEALIEVQPRQPGEFDLNDEDDEGLGWSTLSEASDPAAHVL